MIDPIYQTAIRLLSRREHSALEMQQKLQKRGFTSVQINPIIQQLKQEKLLSEERFVESLINALIQRGYGPIRISQELQQKGIDDAVIAEQLEQDNYFWLEKLKIVQHKKFGKFAPKNLMDRAKQMRFFQYRGFSAEQINRLFKNSGLAED